MITIMEAALVAGTGSGRRVHPELFGLLTDFVTRAVVFPSGLAEDYVVQRLAP